MGAYHRSLGKAWRTAHPHERAVYNLARRVTPQPKACTYCGSIFTPRRRDRLTCSQECADHRKANRRRPAPPAPNWWRPGKEPKP